jgi:hypothetical protein
MGIVTRKTIGVEVGSMNLACMYLWAKRLDAEIITPDLAVIRLG